MDRRASDLVIGALLALGLHGLLLASLAHWRPPATAEVGPLRAERDGGEAPLLMLSAEAARAILEPTLPPPLPSLRDPASAPHLPPVTAPPVPSQPTAAWDLPPIDLSKPSDLFHITSATPAAVERLAAQPPPLEATTANSTDQPPDLEQSGALVLHRPPLVYPEGARRRGDEGTVIVGLRIGEGGVVVRTWLIRSSGLRILDGAAQENLRAWIFDPSALRAAGLGRVFRQRVRFFFD
jgi:periplasmic protein TonB